LLRIARWFAPWDATRRGGALALHAEKRGAIKIPVGERVFELAARADRIERRPDGYAILDYKTGQPPTPKQVRSGLSPQLTLEAAILRRGGFADIPPGAAIAALAYVSLRGGEPAGCEVGVRFDDIDIDTLADRALARFIGIVRRFAEEGEPFRSLVHPMWRTRY